jgi:hypothetical protein
MNCHPVPSPKNNFQDRLNVAAHLKILDSKKYTISRALLCKWL